MILSLYRLSYPAMVRILYPDASDYNPVGLSPGPGALPTALDGTLFPFMGVLPYPGGWLFCISFRQRWPPNSQCCWLPPQCCLPLRLSKVVLQVCSYFSHKKWHVFVAKRAQDEMYLSKPQARTIRKQYIKVQTRKLATLEWLLIERK